MRPRIDYLEDDQNGLMLGPDTEKNVDRFVDILTDRNRYAAACERAYSTAKNLCIQNWQLQMSEALARATQ